MGNATTASFEAFCDEVFVPLYMQKSSMTLGHE